MILKIGRNTWKLIVAVMMAGLIQGVAVAGGPARDAAGPWGEPVDGLVCRLVIGPSFVTGQAMAAVVQVKNISDKKRYIVPRLDPEAIEHLTVEIVGPQGKVSQTSYVKGHGLGEKSFQPINPGEVMRFEVTDLRSNFASLNDWQCYPVRKANHVPAGTYTVQFHFRSPKVPPRFAGAQRVIGGKLETEYQAPSAEMVAGQWANQVTSPRVELQLVPLGKDDLVVHEWGVFTVFNDVKYANVNRKEEWGSLPSFFYRQFPKERLRWMPSAWDKPLVYFYAKQASMRVNVKVTFSEGAPVVWWPAASDPVDDWPGGQFAKKPKPFRSLTWEAWLGDQVPSKILGQAGKVAEFPLPDDCWLNQARLPSASRLTVIGADPNKQRRFPGMQDRPETERFLYYDGLVPAPDYLRCVKVDDQSVTLHNRAKYDIGRLFVVDRRVKGRVGFAALDGKSQPFHAGTKLSIAPKPIAAADWPAAATKQVRQALVDAGLFEPEADSLLQIWHKRLLEAEGVTVFHILPAAEYERMLPLDILPAPAARPVRVGIALHPHVEIEPDLAVTVAALIRQLDDQNFAKRAAASKALLEIGPLAITQLRVELQNGPPLEMSRRMQAILERVDAADWLKPAGKPK